jgi:hypothetical protein
MARLFHIVVADISHEIIRPMLSLNAVAALAHVAGPHGGQTGAELLARHETGNVGAKSGAEVGADDG